MSHTVYLDESGDLGFKFNATYGNGGSSNYLTMAYAICPNEKGYLLSKFVRNVYKKFNFNSKQEIKGSQLKKVHKDFIAQEMLKLIHANADILLCSITVDKHKANNSMRRDSNLLYNYMIRMSVLDKVDTFENVTLLRDNKSVKIESGNSLINYLQTTLTFDHQSETIIQDRPTDSKKHLCLIFADWLNNIVFGHYEKKKSSSFLIISPILRNQTLFF